MWSKLKKSGDNLEKLEKEKLINEKKNELISTFSVLSKELQKTVLPMIDKVSFMSVTLDMLQNEINTNGITEEYKNGANQYGIKKSSAVDVYNTMIKNYTTLMKQLTDLLPKNYDLEEDDGFDDL